MVAAFQEDQPDLFQSPANLYQMESTPDRKQPVHHVEVSSSWHLAHFLEKANQDVEMLHSSFRAGAALVRCFVVGESIVMLVGSSDEVVEKAHAETRFEI